MRIVCDEKLCTGCLACVVTCLDRHYPDGDDDAVSGRRYKKAVKPSGLTQYLTYSCRHCKNAPCQKNCPAGAIYTDGDGWVRVKRELCVGCGTCVGVCPFEIPRLDSDGKMVKCDGCGGEPGCVACCPNGALSVQP